MKGELVCWKCGAALDDAQTPLARLAECSHCRAELHVCRMCAFYDTAVSQQCREPVADAVSDKQRANFCGYFKAKADAYNPQSSQVAEAARAQFDALFGKPTAPAQGKNAADAAREQMENLFKKKK